MNKQYYLTEIIPRLDKKRYVMTGISSMCYNGISTDDIYMPELITECKDIDGIMISDIVSYYWVEKFDYDNYVTPLDGFENIKVPSKERSIIENIKHDFRFVDLGYFLESLERYYSGRSYNRKLLQEVANHFEVDMSVVDYWLKECENYNGNGH